MQVFHYFYLSEQNQLSWTKLDQEEQRSLYIFADVILHFVVAVMMLYAVNDGES
jgi:hypothetical protein